MSPDEIEAFLASLHLEAERLANVIDVPKSLRLQKEAPSEDGCWLTLYWREANDGDGEDGYYIALIRKEAGIDYEEGEASLAFSSNILFAFYERVAHQMAVRQSGQLSDGDPRRKLFATQEALLAQLNPEWANWTKHRHELILTQSPWRDEAR